MFYERVDELCKENGTTISAVLVEMGIPKSNGTYWKNGATPSGDIVAKFARRFNVCADYLLGLTDEKNNFEVIKTEGKRMNEKARESLKNLSKWLEHLRKVAELPDVTNEFDDEMNVIQLKNELAIKFREKIKEIGIEKESLYEWSVYNFKSPPTEVHLKELLSLCKEVHGIYPVSSIYEFDEIDKNINDYVYYVSEEKSPQPFAQDGEANDAI